MANTFVTAKQVSALAVALLARSLVLPGTVSRVPATEFAGDNGDTVTIRVPTPSAARTQTTPGTVITYDDLSETPVDVTLAHLYHATRVTDEDMSLKIVDFGAQVTSIQVDAVARGAEDRLAAVMNALPADDATVTGANVAGAVLAARTALGEADVPATDRFLAVAPDFAEQILGLETFSAADSAGDGGDALREAIIGRFRGFTVVESNALTAGTALAYHRSSFAFANRVPVAPESQPKTASAIVGSVGIRQVFQYVPDRLADASVVSTFAGAALVDADRVYKLSLTAES
ncbi:P22 phage major capsid protein family protein [Spirillospora sp. NBC_01491]|uniref:P22 phage major capsid protein family protein n=1 Tax=Spirillospora sp. NBC_01491 TaxID=2976007 RepID=UPI002E2FF25A|nr:P22 phage major capsid protein family protein [Spirillospora sp. NBC_01491]